MGEYPMVSGADLFQAIKGTDFKRGGATITDLLEAVEGKRDHPMWNDEDLEEVMEAIQAMPEDARFRNPSQVVSELGAIHEAIEQGYGIADSKKGRSIHTERSDVPLGKGKVKANPEGAKKASELHEKHKQRDKKESE